MRPWDVYTWTFPDAGAHPVVIIGTDDRLRLKDKVNVLLCSSQLRMNQPWAYSTVAAVTASSAGTPRSRSLPGTTSTEVISMPGRGLFHCRA